MKKLMFSMVVMFCVAAFAMPSRSELKKAQPIVNELMSPIVADFNAKKKKAKDVAATAEMLAKEADQEASKFLLLKGAIIFYVRGGEYDKAADAVDMMQREVKDIPSETLAEIISSASSRINGKTAPRLFAQYKMARARVKAGIEIKNLNKVLKKNPNDMGARKRYAEFLIVDKGWESALPEFAKLNDKTGEIAKLELSGKAKAAVLADFWWNYESQSSEIEHSIQQRAAKHYRTAIAANELLGLKKVLAEKRLNEIGGDVEKKTVNVEKPAVDKQEVSKVNKVVKPSSVAKIQSRPGRGKTKRHTIELDGGVKINFVECPPGSVDMGVSDNPTDWNRRHKAIITRPFWIAETKLTIKQYKAWKKDYNPSNILTALGGDEAPLHVDKKNPKEISDFEDGRNFDEFCRYLTEQYAGKIPKGYVFRLPTEAEWEYAYVANERNPFSPYVIKEVYSRLPNHEKLGLPNRKIMEMLKDKGIQVKHNFVRFAGGGAVKQYPSNNWGLYDMIGNKPELMADIIDCSKVGHGWPWGETQEALRYELEEVDPLRYNIDCRDPRHLIRGGAFSRLEKFRDWSGSVRLCVGPALETLNVYPKK